MSRSTESPPAVSLSCSRPQPTRSLLHVQLLHPGQNWMEQQDNVHRRCSAFTLNFLSKIQHTKDVCVLLMPPKHNERFFFPPQIILDGDSSILRASEKTFFPLLHIFCLCDCVRRERCLGTTCPYTKLFYNYIENKFQLKYDLLLVRGLWGKSCAAASLQESFKDD